MQHIIDIQKRKEKFFERDMKKGNNVNTVFLPVINFSKEFMWNEGALTGFLSGGKVIFKEKLN